MTEGNCIDQIANRRSIRKFKDEKIPDDVIDELIRTGLWAPSAGNLQPWRIVKTTSEDQIKTLADAAYGQSVVKTAPAVLVIVAVPSESAEKYGQRGRSLYAYQDTAALTYTLLLTAHAMGYGGCWVGAFDDEAAANAISAPDGFKPVSMIPIGVPDESPSPRPRKAPSEVVVEDRFGEIESAI
ncbi:nitroreductase family protein [Candidatus Thorarchaeota archaeon]|nr:MAG: nitroreductase family protein [Candidatus Thorarchaeota archaeon]